MAQRGADPVAESLEPANEHLVQLLPPLAVKAAEKARTLGSVMQVRANALCFVDQREAFRGYASAVSLMAIPAVLVGWYIRLTSELHWFDFFLVPLQVLTTPIAFWLLQQDITGYRYEPVAVSKADRKVHVFRSLGLWWWELGWKLWGRVPAETLSYDWHCVRAEIVQVVIFTGQILRRESGLVFAITDQPGSNKVIARFGVGPTVGYGQHDMLIERWEHIRRFMQSQGPLWQSGDVLYQLDEPTLKAALIWGQPVLEDGLVATWRDQPFGLALISTFMLIAWPFFALIGLMRYLSYKVLREPRWPPEIEAVLGPVVEVEVEHAASQMPERGRRRRAKA
jgi:hypothetical protein